MYSLGQSSLSTNVTSLGSDALRGITKVPCKCVRLLVWIIFSFEVSCQTKPIHMKRRQFFPSKQWRNCDTRSCRRWVHVKCEEVASARPLNSREVYICPTCQQVSAGKQSTRPALTLHSKIPKKWLLPREPIYNVRNVWFEGLDQIFWPELGKAAPCA